VTAVAAAVGARFEPAGADGIARIVLDRPDDEINALNPELIAALGAAVRDARAATDLRGLVVASAKADQFMAGADLKMVNEVSSASDVEQASRRFQAVCDELAWLPCTTVAAINGAALGGGFEITLACHHRVVVDDPKAVVGFPEVQLGLLPGAGGVVRSVRMLGIATALMQLLMQGQRLKPAQAKELGVVDEIVATREELVPAAKAWIKANPDATQPWDVKGYKIPGGTPSTPSLAQNLPAFPANLRKQLKGANYPAPMRSWPSRSRERRSTSTTRSRSRAVTSSTSPRARSPRT